MALVCSAKSKIWMAICILSFGLTLFLVIGGALGWFNFELFLGTENGRDVVDVEGEGTGYASGVIISNSRINTNMRHDGDYLQGGVSSSPRNNYSRTSANTNTRVGGNTAAIDKEGSGGSSGGVCSCNQTEILLKLPKTLRGLPGEKGNSGGTGPAGPPGAPGVEGRQGIRGERGERGDLGATGPEGIQGPKGEEGAIGPPGLPGRPGSPGPSGSPTLLGLDPDWRPRNMLKESLGGSGGGGGMARPGLPGSKGEIGEQGEMGWKGDKGTTGEKGERGQVGARGEKGERGHAGPKGDNGSPGIDGLPGLPGNNGLKGDIGPMGPPGLGSGTFSWEGILTRIDIVKGGRGGIGPMGHPGEMGVPGVPGQKGDAGEPGAPGPVIQMNGGGTVVKGDKGERGRRGKRGMPGLPGPSGDIGIPGWLGRAGSHRLPIQGPKGSKGEPAVLPENFFNYKVSGPGLRGPPGLPGPPGPTWKPDGTDFAAYVPVAGPPGPKGDIGSQGLPGLSFGPGVVVVISREGLLKLFGYSPLGSIAFVKEEERLFARVSEGWMPILMGDLLRDPP